MVSHYFGESYESVHGTFPMSLEINGEEKILSFIFYTQTIADSPTRNLINSEKSLNDQEYIFSLPESGKVDAVYYVDFDIEKIASGKDSWNSILERALLIWEK